MNVNEGAVATNVENVATVQISREGNKVPKLHLVQNEFSNAVELLVKRVVTENAWDSVATPLSVLEVETTDVNKSSFFVAFENAHRFNTKQVVGEIGNYLENNNNGVLVHAVMNGENKVRHSNGVHMTPYARFVDYSEFNIK